jgi:hypothetical protein
MVALTASANATATDLCDALLSATARYNVEPLVNLMCLYGNASRVDMDGNYSVALPSAKPLITVVDGADLGSSLAPLFASPRGIFSARILSLYGHDANAMDSQHLIQLSTLLGQSNGDHRMRPTLTRAVRLNSTLSNVAEPAAGDPNGATAAFALAGPSHDNFPDTRTNPRRLKHFNLSTGVEEFWQAFRWAKHSNAAERRRAIMRDVMQASARSQELPLPPSGTGDLDAPPRHLSFMTVAQSEIYRECRSLGVMRTRLKAAAQWSRDEIDDAIDQGDLHLADVFELDLAFLCNHTTMPDLATLQAVSTMDKRAIDAFSASYVNASSVFLVILRYGSDEGRQHALESGAWMFLFLTAGAVLTALWATSPLVGATHTSLGLSSRIAYGTIGWETLLWISSVSTYSLVGSAWASVSRGLLLVGALTQISVYYNFMTIFYVVRRAHRQVNIRSGAQMGLLAHFAAVLLLGFAINVFGERLLSPPFVVALTSTFVPQLWHSIAEGQPPGISTTVAARLAVSRVLSLAPFLLPSTSMSLFFLPQRRTSLVAAAVWLAVQVALLDRQHRRGPLAVIPVWFRPRHHVYSISASELLRSAATSTPAEAEHECSICRTDLQDEDEGATDGSGHPHAASPATAAAQAAHHAVVVDHESRVWRTPCGHAFHKDCLLRWMDERMDCPLCRTRLPRPVANEDVG